MMEFNVIGRGASSVVRTCVRARLGPHGAAIAYADTHCAFRPRAQVKKANHVASHRFVALKCISVLEKARGLSRGSAQHTP
jgi:hypothetical protein